MINKRIFFFKRRRKNDIKNFFSEFVTKESGFIVYLDSFREVNLRIFVLHIFKLIFKFKTILLLTSVSAGIPSAITLRKPLNSFSIRVSKLLFPKNLQNHYGLYYGFYDFKIVILLFLIRNNKFNPWFEGCSSYVDSVISRYPLTDNHSKLLSDYNIPVVYKGEFFSNYKKKFDKSKNVLFAMPQFFEQGFMTREKANEVILKMLKYIEKKEGVYPDIILHPRMNKTYYKKYGSEINQHNLTEILPKYKRYYTINSSTIFLACSFKCDCSVFKIDELDYSFMDVLIGKFPINFIKLK